MRSIDQLAQRVDRLEKQNQRVWRLVVVLPCLAVLLGAAADNVWSGKKVVAEEFVLVGKNGETLSSLKLRDDALGPILAMYDKAGKVRAAVTVQGDKSGAFLLLNKDQKRAVVVGQNDMNGIGSIDFYDAGEFKGGHGGSAYDRK